MFGLYWDAEIQLPEDGFIQKGYEEKRLCLKAFVY